MTEVVASALAPSRDLATRFEAIRWAFSDSTPTAPHHVHPYPARFIPEVPRASLDLADELVGDVLDPFCGAGTTLVEALRANRGALGIDLNPIATLISRVKVQPWRHSDDDELQHHATELRWWSQAGSAETLAAARERIPRLDHWFAPEAQWLLAGATAYLDSLVDPIWRDRIALAISASVVRISRQDSDTRYAAIDKPFAQNKAVASLERALLKIGAQLRAFSGEHPGSAAVATVLTGDARELIQKAAPNSFAAAIFSPPYPNAYEYWLYHKYRMYWLGFDPLGVRSSELGARPHYSGSGRSTIETFGGQMQPVMAGVARALVPGGLCVIVVADSRIKGQIVDTASVFERLGHDVGLHSVARAVRPIRLNRKSFNLAIARIRSEHVLLLQKP